MERIWGKIIPEACLGCSLLEGLVKMLWCARVKAVREMPRPCVEDVAQAPLILPVSKNVLTKSAQCAEALC